MHTAILTSRRGLRAGLEIALVALAVAGCASASDRNAAPSQPSTTKAAPVATNTASAAPEPPAAAEPAAATTAQVDPTGKTLEVIWTRPPSKQDQHEHGVPSADALYATRVSVNDTWLAVDVKSEGRISSSPWRGKLVQPEVSLLVDGCPAKAPGLRPVSLGYGGTEGRLMMHRGDLPQGDLDITFTAFGKQHTMVFANDEKGLRTITSRERKDTHVRPGDPADGIPDMVTVIPSKCDAADGPE